MTNPCTALAIAGFCLLLTIHNSAAKETFTDLAQDSFYKKPKVQQYVSLGGNYKSDYNSHEHEISGGYKYKSNKYIHEIDFFHEQVKASTTKIPLRTTKEFYDFELASRALIASSNNYINYYNRIQYDEFSYYYYDVSNAIGLGRVFMDGMADISANVGYRDVKSYNSEFIFIPIAKVKFDLTKKLKLTMKGSWITKESDYDRAIKGEEELKTSLSYKLDKKTSLVFLHNYNKKRYLDSKNRLIVRASRGFSVRVKYDF